jgi:hypothetical protein
MALSGDDLDSSFFSEPQVERSGAEFTLVMCGCFTPVIVSQGGNLDSIFDSGEVWVVEGRFFERFESFEPLSALFGGSGFGFFDPTTRLRFEHDVLSDQTTITLVYPMTNVGAAMVAGHAVQPVDLSLSNDTSIEEALDDLIIGADFGSGPLGVMTSEWQNQDLNDFMNPVEWNVTALIGTAPLTAQPSSFYVWTDTGFDELMGDLNLNEMLDVLDEQVVEDYIDDNDGTVIDDDQTVNGQIGIADFGLNFHFYDQNYDGVISEDDLPEVPCAVDFFADGILNFFDVSEFLIAFGQQDPRADLFPDKTWNFLDVSLFLTMYGQGCP